ncbi:protein NEDD1 isoform X2 [Aplysia californica]|uniref:Protein NEDD1 isoform X2 n=1 Tax=Aplysia californica TaxID=6500 RepID=A0ABM0JLP9_APLCA|nr:protein NEDD1 isoform X2 [Aplysia californica]
MYLASSGVGVKIWDIGTSTLKEEFTPFDGCVSDMSWSHNGKLIAACSSTNNTVHLGLTKSGLSVPSESFSLPAGCISLDFNSTSRYILCGCADEVVRIWDRKTQEIKKSFSNFHIPITVARWNWNDTCIALGSEKGEIVLCNVITGVVNSPLVTPSTQAIRQLLYNPYRKASLVSASEDGAVNFWDTNTRRLVHSFKSVHQAPARDLAFSPINDCLMVSVGLDKRCVFYDIQNKKSINTTVGEHPLTSVDLMHDGVTLVAGSSQGKIFVYDMRQPSSPVSSLPAHRSSVKRLSFTKQDDGKEDSVSSQGSRRQLPAAPSSLIDSLNQNSNSEGFQSPRGHHLMSGLGTSALSPLKEGQGVISPLQHENSLSIGSAYGFNSLNGGNSFISDMLKSGDNSLMEERPAAQSNKSLLSRYASSPGNAADASISPTRVQRSPPRSFASRGLGASPSLQQLSSPRTDPSGTAAAAILAGSPTHHAASAPRPAPSRHSPLSSSQSATTPPPHSWKNLENSHGAEVTHGADYLLSQSEGSRQRINDEHSPYGPKHTNGLPHAATPPKGLNPESSVPQTPPSSVSLASSSSALRHLVRDLLKEQFQEHQEHLKSEIRAMMQQSSSLETGGARSSGTDRVTRRDPSMFQAEFIRNLIREDLEDMQEKMHEEFWSIRVELVKQVFQLEKKMEAGLAECMINPLLLNVIEEQREEIARLKKVF